MNIAIDREAAWVAAFREARIPEKSKDWSDYEKGKQVLFRMNLSPDEYEEGLRILLEWLAL